LDSSFISCNVGKDDDCLFDESTDEEEFPEPDTEEIEKIKESYRKRIEDAVSKMDKFLDLLSHLELSKTYPEVVKICEKIENTFES
jgi:uncharacterized FlaG/YvyC family protein